MDKTHSWGHIQEDYAVENPKLRKNLINLHLLFAGFLAPAFLLLAISGGLYLIGNKGKFDAQPMNLPAAASLDFNSPTLETDVRNLLASANIDHKFGYISKRGASKIHLRPTSRTYIEFNQTPDGLTAFRVSPDFQGSMIELHKGHGPKLFKTYQKLVAIGLLGVVFGGVFVGLLARAYRRKTLVALSVGTLLFFILAIFA
ncbi:hypothetical protein [Fretibacter rubidus]|uniref:hypothetical protein n=1 Tax=Fretibacter rubidus TaxID=570162 RepID=UPI00352BCB4E